MEANDLLVGKGWRMASLAVECDASVTMSVVPSSATSVCPACGMPSSRKHSWYRRTALDLPWRKSTVLLRIWARRFFVIRPTADARSFC